MMLAWLSSSVITASSSLEQRLEQAAVGVEAARIEDGVVGPQKRGERRLELLVHALRAADEAHRGHAEAVAIEAVLRRADEPRDVGEPEVVVGAEVEHLAARLRA